MSWTLEKSQKTRYCPGIWIRGIVFWHLNECLKCFYETSYYINIQLIPNIEKCLDRLLQVAMLLCCLAIFLANFIFLNCFLLNYHNVIKQKPISFRTIWKRQLFKRKTSFKGLFLFSTLLLVLFGSGSNLI